MNATLFAPRAPSLELPAPFQALPRAGEPSPPTRGLGGVAVAILLHGAFLAWLVSPPGEVSEVVIPPQPYMTVSLVSPTEPAPTPRPRAEPVRPKEKAPAVKPKETVSKPTLQPKQTPLLTSAAIAANPAETSAPAAPAAAPAPPAPGPVKEAPVAIAPPRFDAAYLSNPAPPYPTQSRRMGEEGRVLLKVLVGADGLPLEVSIVKSSGFARLDDAARDTVLRSWRFVPARQGDKAVAGAVKVPIDFSLNSAS